MIEVFIKTLWLYVVEVLPVLALGFLISGVVHEFVPQNFIDRHFNKKGIKPLLYVIAAGIFLPICCIGSLPVAVGLRKKGVSLGPVFAFLIATPATSISAVLVTWRLFGGIFTLYLCAAVIVMGLLAGVLGDLFPNTEIKNKTEACPMCEEGSHENHFHHREGAVKRTVSVLSYAFIDMPKEIGVELVIGLLIAAAIASFSPVRHLIKMYLTGGAGYFFSLILGLVMYICSTASVPMAHAFVQSGLSHGAGLVLLLVGPITSYGTILVIRKEFGTKILLFYLFLICSVSLLAGYFYHLIQ